MHSTDEFQSGLSPLKLAWLVALTLVAGTLSTRAWVMPAESETAKARSARPCSTDEGGSTQPKSESEQAFEIAPQADVWHGVAERPPVERPASTLEHLLAAGSCNVQDHPGATAPWSEVLPDGSPRQRCRLICRDTHAPPVNG